MKRTQIVTIRGSATQSTSTGFVSTPIHAPARIKSITLSTSGANLSGQVMAVGLSEDSHTPTSAGDVGTAIFEMPTGQSQVGETANLLSFDVDIPIEEEIKFLKAYVTNSEETARVIAVYAVVEFDRGNDAENNND